MGLVVFFMFITFARNKVWYDDLPLWQDVEKKSPNKDRAHFQLGFYFAAHDRVDAAIREYETVIKIIPNASDAYNNLGQLYEKKDRHYDAFTAYQAAVKFDPENAEPHNNLGLFYQKRGSYVEAMGQYEIALSLQPHYATALQNLFFLCEELNYNSAFSPENYPETSKNRHNCSTLYEQYRSL